MSERVLVEEQTVSRKTPGDGRLEISASAAARLASLGESFALRTPLGDGRARLHEMSCTCAKSVSGSPHHHHFVESEVLRALEPGTSVRIELDDAQPGSLSVRPASGGR